MISIFEIREIYGDENLPSIKDLTRERIPENKDEILDYLKRGSVIAVAAGRATDFISGETIDGDFFCYSDGKYIWRSDTIYFFERYNIELPKDFVEHALKN